MLNSLFNKVVGLQDCCKTCLLHALLRFYFSLAKTLSFLRNVKFKVMPRETYLEPSRTSAIEVFSLRLSYILKTYLIRSNCF